ncbi:MAG: hypothetical protein OEN50_20120 [Deltaproteobacteria bacterium]|nr:hypothetical protein [Deltaproteobacteria bacterium]
MSGENLIIPLLLILVVAKLYYEVGKIVGKGEKREAHDLYQEAATISDHEKRLAMINKANNLVFPNRAFTEAFKLGTKK